jgi:uncharacterized membrane protein YagU involved in acid resistance
MYINLEPLRLIISLSFTITFGLVFVMVIIQYNDTASWIIGLLGLVTLLMWQGCIVWNMFGNSNDESEKS